jgi:hypothetical protein
LEDYGNFGNKKQITADNDLYTNSQENINTYDTWGPSFLYSQLDFWDNKRFDSIEKNYYYLEDFIKNDYNYKDIKKINNSNILPDNDFYSDNYGFSEKLDFNSKYVIGLLNDFSNKYDSNLFGIAKDKYHVGSGIQDKKIKVSSNYSEDYLYPNLTLVDFFFRSKNDISLSILDGIGSTSR